MAKSIHQQPDGVKLIFIQWYCNQPVDVRHVARHGLKSGDLRFNRMEMGQGDESIQEVPVTLNEHK